MILRIVLFVFLVTLIPDPGRSSTFAAETLNSNENSDETRQIKADKWRRDYLTKVENWRAETPDWDYRLYNRLKAVNKRVVSTRGIVIIGFSLVLFFMGGVFWLFLMGKIGFRPYVNFQAPLGSENTTESVSDNSPMPQSQTFAMIDGIRLRLVERRQRKLKDLLVRLERSLGEYQDGLGALRDDQQQIEHLLNSCNRITKDLDVKIKDVLSG